MGFILREWCYNLMFDHINIANFIRKDFMKKDLPPLVSADAFFENPESAEQVGIFHFSYVGHFRRLHISFNGDIDLDPSFEFPEHYKVVANFNYNNIFITNTEPKLNTGDDILFRFVGEMTKINFIKVLGYNQGRLRATIKKGIQNIEDDLSGTIDSDSTNAIEDMTILLQLDPDEEDRLKRMEGSRGYSSPENDDRGTYSTRKYKKRYIKSPRIPKPAIPDKNFREKVKPFQNKKYSNLRSRLPDNYDYTMEKSKHCGNCYFLKSGNFCKLWKAPVKSNFICNSWLNVYSSREEMKEWLTMFRLKEEHRNINVNFRKDI